GATSAAQGERYPGTETGGHLRTEAARSAGSSTFAADAERRVAGVSADRRPCGHYALPLDESPPGNPAGRPPGHQWDSRDGLVESGRYPEPPPPLHHAELLLDLSQ